MVRIEQAQEEDNTIVLVLESLFCIIEKITTKIYQPPKVFNRDNY